MVIFGRDVMIKEYRKLNRLTQKRLADLANMPRQTVSWCERNEYKMTPQIKQLRQYIKHAYAYNRVAEAYRKPLVETKSNVNFFVRLWRWLKC
jgi:DNA-binding XRE family transcriptional regulator